MRRLMILLALGLMALLAACGGTASAPTATSQPQGYSAPTVSAPTTAPQPTVEANVPAATPVATPDIQKIVNPQPDDWSRGPKDAKVTIIEWGDFQ